MKLTKLALRVGIPTAIVGSVLAVYQLSGSEDNQLATNSALHGDEETLNPSTPAAEQIEKGRLAESKGDAVVSKCPTIEAQAGTGWLAGNWFAVWSGVPRALSPQSWQHPDTARLVIRADPKTGALLVNGAAWFRDGRPATMTLPNNVAVVHPIGLLPDSDTVLRTGLAHYRLPRATLILDSTNPDIIQGTWETLVRYDGKPESLVRGTVEWTRIPPVVEKVVFRSEQNLELPVVEQRTMSICGLETLSTSEVGKISMTYTHNGWSDEFATLRGNRPNFSIEFYGKDLWGQRLSWIDYDNTGIEAMPPQRIFSESDPREVVGVRVRFNIWYGVQPGMYTLFLDDKALPFELDIPNYYPSVELEYVQIDDDGTSERVIDEVPLNQEFWVRAEVVNPERFDSSKPITVVWNSKEYSAVAEPTSSTTWRAGPYYIADNVYPSTVVPFVGPCDSDE